MFDGSSHTRSLRTLCGACASSLAACLCVALVLAACDESFGPIAPSELGFSVFGYLDASADTQCIRVMPIRPLKVTSQDAFAATVTLEHLGTGRIIELRDSLFRFSSYLDPALGSEGQYVHNFWTLEDIEPGASYRFSARREGKEPAEAVVEVPRDYEVEVAIMQFPDYLSSDSLQITRVKHVPFVVMLVDFSDACGMGVARKQYKTSSADDEAHVTAISRFAFPARPGCGVPEIKNWRLWIVGSEAAWPVRAEYSPRGLGESGRTSNVTNAVGFVGGVLTKLIPYENCGFQSAGAPVPDYCRLRYNRETATVSGTVRDTGCSDGPIEGATVQLTELDRDPARVRTVFNTQAGKFLIGALEPGIPHLLRASAPEGEPIYVYGTHTDTLTFMPGQQVEYDISLACSQPSPGAR
jgi:hypothetical protein